MPYTARAADRIVSFDPNGTMRMQIWTLIAPVLAPNWQPTPGRSWRAASGARHLMTGVIRRRCAVRQ